MPNVDNHPARAADMAILKDSRGLGCIVLFVAGATLTAGSTLKFEPQFTDSGSPEQAIARSLTEQATEQNRPRNIDRAKSTEQLRPSKRPRKIDRAKSTEQNRPSKRPRKIDRAKSTEQNRPSKIDRAKSTEQNRPSKRPSKIDRATSTAHESRWTWATNAGDQRVREREIEMGNDMTENSVASHCYALIVYEQPSPFTTVERSVLQHGTPAEVDRVLRNFIVRSMGIPACIVTASDCNYSSAKMDFRGRYA